jgi:hypothetical protein
VQTVTPDWSPNGRWLTFRRFGDRPSHIFRIRSDGTHREDLTKLTGHKGADWVEDRGAAWSPNGKRIAFVRGFDRPRGGPNVFVMRLDGTHLHQITRPVGRYEDYGPQWSPDGTHLAFKRYTESECGCRAADQSALFTIRVDGTHLQRLTPWRLDGGDDAYEEQPGEPTPEAIAPLKTTHRRPGEPFGVEPPASFWPKFEHRFRPAEELWVAEGLPGCIRVGGAADIPKRLFEAILAARDELASALPPDGQTPRSRAGGLAILKPMRRLEEAMTAFTRYAIPLRPDLRGWGRAKRAARADYRAREAERSRWAMAGPYEGLNY